MVTVNNRVGIPQAMVINGVDAGGAMSAAIVEGYENTIRSAPDGSQIQVMDREVQYVRGTVVTQDWVHLIDLLTGTVGTYVFYERKSGVAEATGYIKHTLTNPVIHNCRINLAQGGYGTATFGFECKAADETKGITDMHGITDDQSAPAVISSARGGFRIETSKFSTGGGIINIYHTTAFDFGLALPLVKACNDGDVGYTCVDARLDGIAAGGSISFQDTSISAGALLCQQLLVHARDQLELTVRQSQGATSKDITILGAIFGSGNLNSDVNAEFTDYNMPYEISNDPSLPLTLAGTNKIITIADAA